MEPRRLSLPTELLALTATLAAGVAAWCAGHVLWFAGGLTRPGGIRADDTGRLSYGLTIAEAFALGLVSGALAIVAGVRLFRRWTVRYWNPARCPSCGYDVHASGPRCPECGTETVR